MDQNSLLKFAESRINDGDVANWEKEIFRFIRKWFDQNDFIYANTSGSSGKPKQIKLLKKHMLISASATLNFLDIKKGDKILLCLPAEYIAGMMMIVRALSDGLKLYYTKPTINQNFQTTEKFNLTAVVPSMLSNILNLGREKELEKFGNILIGGSGISFEDEKKLSILSNNIWHTYGMTETITHIALRKINGKSRSNWFTPFDEVGLNLTKDKTLIINYDKIGVSNLVTNDFAELLANGNFKIIGRKDNAIISGGLKIHPEETENKLAGIIENSFFVYGLPDNKLGQKAILFIEGKITKTKQQLLKEIGKELAKEKRPKEIISVTQFERTASGKIIRRNYQGIE